MIFLIPISGTFVVACIVIALGAGVSAVNILSKVVPTLAIVIFSAIVIASVIIFIYEIVKKKKWYVKLITLISSIICISGSYLFMQIFRVGMELSLSGIIMYALKLFFGGFAWLGVITGWIVTFCFFFDDERINGEDTMYMVLGFLLEIGISIVAAFIYF